MTLESPRRKLRTRDPANPLKLSAAAICIPVAGWLAVLLLSRLLLRCGWIDSHQAWAMAELALLVAPLHVLVVLAQRMLGADFVELSATVSWRMLAAIVAASAPVFVAIVTTNLVLNHGQLSPSQAVLSAVAAHVALLCVVPLFARVGGRD